MDELIVFLNLEFEVTVTTVSKARLSILAASHILTTSAATDSARLHRREHEGKVFDAGDYLRPPQAQIRCLRM